MNTPLYAYTKEEQATVRTVAFFAVFGLPVTVQEIVKYSTGPGMKTSAVGWATVRSLVEKQICGVENGLVYLQGNREACMERTVRYPHAILKHRRVLRWARILRRMPGVQGVAIGNSLAYHFTAEKSDADLFIATRTGQTWLARFCTTVPLMLLRQRPGQQARHPLDLSFYADEQHWKLATVSLPNDPYLEHWLLSLSPVVDGEWLRMLWKKNTDWIKKYPHAQPVRRAYAFRTNTVRWYVRWPSVMEVLASLVQRWQFPASIALFMNKDTRVRVEEGLLKFHTNDRRAEYAEKYEQLCARCGVTPYPSL